MNKIEKTDAQWREELPPERYDVLRRGGTERAFSGKLYHNHDEGTYACGACGATLFSSATKFESGSGWPSFLAPDDQRTCDCSRTARTGWSAPRRVARTAARTSATSSTTAPRRPDSATA